MDFDTARGILHDLIRTCIYDALAFPFKHENIACQILDITEMYLLPSLVHTPVFFCQRQTIDCTKDYCCWCTVHMHTSHTVDIHHLEQETRHKPFIYKSQNLSTISCRPFSRLSYKTHGHVYSSCVCDQDEPAAVSAKWQDRGPTYLQYQVRGCGHGEIKRATSKAWDWGSRSHYGRGRASLVWACGARCTNLTLSSDVDQDTCIFGLHERPLTYQCNIS